MKRILIIVCSILFVALSICFLYYYVVYYDNTKNYDKTVSRFSQALIDKNQSLIYKYYSDDIKEKYNRSRTEALLEKFSPLDKKNIEVTSIYSSDNFLITATKKTEKLVFAFGGGWGRGWKVTAIRVERK